MKIAIKVTHQNCYLLDGVIEQYDLRWAAYALSARRLKETAVMNNYLVIDLETKTLQWTECNLYIEVDVLTLIDKLKVLPKTNTIKQWEVRYITSDNRLVVMGYLTEGKAEEAISFLNPKATILNGPTYIEHKIEL